MLRRSTALMVSLILIATAFVAVANVTGPLERAGAATTSGPLHTNGTDSNIYDASNQPVRLVGFNWSGTENGGRSDYQKIADPCGAVWRTPADPLGGLSFNYDNFYQVLRDSGYNVIRIPISWNNFEPVAPVWNASSGTLTHTWNQTYLNDLKSMVTKARANGIMVILDMHQDYWSPSLHNITRWNGEPGYCEGVGMPRWLNPTIDAKATTDQNVDFYNAMNQFYRNVRDPASTLTNVTPWQLLYSAWDQIAYQFSPQSGFAAASAVVGADILNEPYWSYVGGSPPAGQTVQQAAGARLQSFYNALAPAVTTHDPSWLLIFEDVTGGYYAANPAYRETPMMTAKPTVPGNWVYSGHLYDFTYGTFSDGVVRHDDFGITLANVMLANANAWHVPLYFGEFTNFTLETDGRYFTDATMAQTKLFLNWAKQNRVSWTFWAYMAGYRGMSLIDYATNQAMPVVKRALDSGLDTATVNQPPVASFTSSCNQRVCSFNGSASSDPDGSISGYAWTFGDGGTATGATPAHTYAAAGTYPVTLTVTDNLGATGSKTTNVTVTVTTTLYASDAFSRTVANGWGSADQGGAWTTGGGAANFAVNSGTGAITMAAGAGPSAFLNGVSSTNTDVQVTMATNKVTTGGAIYLSAVGRRVAGAGEYRAKVRIQSNGKVGVTLVRVSAAGAETTIKTEVALAGITYTAPTNLRVRLQVTGTNPTTVRAKAWLASAAEPAAWTTTVTDTTAALQVPGGVGLVTYLSGSSTNAPIVARYDNFQAGPGL